MSRFGAGFSDYLHNGILSDVTLRLDSKSYKAHRIILAYSSEFFKKLFSSKFKEVNQRIIELKFEDPKDVFPQVLQFMYEGYLHITKENVIALLTASQQYFIPTLRDQCTEYVSSNLGKDSAIQFLRDAIDFVQEDIQERCIDTIAANFLWLTESSIPDFSWLFPQTLEKLLKNPRLAVSNEYSVYCTVTRYIDAHPELDDAQVERLAKHIRFRWLTSKQLMEALAHPRIPKKHLITGALLRLRETECTSRVPPPFKLSRRHEKRRWMGVQVEWDRSEPSLRGILHWLGTDMNRRTFINPAQIGIVNVTASSLAIGNAEDIVDLQAPARRVWTQDVPASWICIDLIDWAIKPTGYSLRHGGDYRADALRNWDFQGSNNGKTWQLLKRHSDDPSLDGPHAIHTWSVVGAIEPYTSFRIIQTGQNSNNHNFLVVAGIELFGEVWEWSTKGDQRKDKSTRKDGQKRRAQTTRTTK